VASKRVVTGGLQIGLGLISFSILIAALDITIAGFFVNDLGVRLVILALGVAAIGVLWTAAIRNGQVEREARKRLQAEHAGALVERVRVWTLPNGRPEPHTPMQFLVADAREVRIETINQTVLVRIPVADLGFVGLVRAQGDKARDRAITLIYGSEQHSVQFFTITYSSLDKLQTRLRTAIGWPAEGAPGDDGA
jgi:hypothetical protein